MFSIKILFRFALLFLFLGLNSCKREKIDPSKITMRPKIFLEGAAPIPLFDEYDIQNVQIGTVQNMFSDNENDRVFAVWLGLDRRASFYLQKETSGNLGRRLQLVINGQIRGIHPIETTLTNGVLPFILPAKMTENEARFLYEQLSQSILFIRAEMESKK